MGFLDFLKKDKPAQSAAVQMPAPPGLPKDPSQIDWTQPPRFDDLPTPSSKDNPVPTAAMLANPLRRDPLPPEIDHDDGDFDKIPLPPVSMQDPDFLDSAAEDLNPKKPEVVKRVVEKVVEKVVEVPQQAPPVPPQPMPQPVAPPVPQPAKIELPDFTDDEIAALEQPAQPSAWSLPKVDIVTEEPIVPKPANAVAIPPEDVKLPTGELLELDRMEPAKFISSDSYFTIIADIKAIRKSLRANDDVIKDATLRHEQLDLQFKRVAADINAVQEHFMKIDGALFEE